MKHYRLTIYKDGKFVGPTAMMLGTNKRSAVALARDLSAKYGLDYWAAAYDDHGNLIEHGRKLTRQKLDASAAFP
jgi:hypothetical protein